MVRAATKSKGATAGQLRLEIERAAQEAGRPRPAAPAAPTPPPIVETRYVEEPDKGPFGAWLITQKARGGMIGALATAAAADRGFPKSSTPDEVRKRLGTMGADPDMFEAVDDAETDWLAY